MSSTLTPFTKMKSMKYLLWFLSAILGSCVCIAGAIFKDDIAWAAGLIVWAILFTGGCIVDQLDKMKRADNTLTYADPKIP